jgi:CMP-N-acetylneuraminic acid synthetase
MGMTGVTAFVPARSGSKRLPGKNLKPLAGKPLLLWTLEAFASAPSVERIVFSTDSEAYWDVARSHLPSANLVWDFRDALEAGDTVKLFDYLKAAHEKIFAEGDTVAIVGLPTAPFRRVEHIESALTLFRETGRPVFSATAFEFPISLGFRLRTDGGWEPVDPSNPLATGKTRSQDHRPAYHPNGALYVRSIEDFADPALQTFFEGAIPLIMEREDSIDIDTAADFRLAECLAGDRQDNDRNSLG